MIVFEILKMSVKTLKSNFMRTLLTILGIVIGVASIIALTAMGEGATETLMTELSSLGSDKFFVSIDQGNAKNYLSDIDLSKIAETEGVIAVSPNITGRYDVTGAYATEKKIKIEGKDHVFFDKNDILLEGRGLNQFDVLNKTNVVVIGEDLSKNLFGNISSLDKKIKIKGIEFTVVGVTKSFNGASMETGSDVAYVPYTFLTSIFAQGGINSIEVYFDTSLELSEVKTDLETTLYFIFNSAESYNIFSIEGIMAMLEMMTQTMGALVTGIASIALLVGGIGIMNMMLTSVTERTNEIGLKKALGAKNKVIMLQFIVEAVIISLIGGLLGILLGYGLANIGGIVLDFTPIITMSAILQATGFSIAVGLIFGIFPAKKAAKLKPIEALRSL